MTFNNSYSIKLAGAFFARSQVLLALAGILLLSVLIACAGKKAGEVDTYTVGGNVTGHTGEVSLTLTYGADDKTETLKVFENGRNFAFEAKLVTEQSFTLAFTTPQRQICSSSLTGGTIVDANITNIEITCNDLPPSTYSVSGTITGAASSGDVQVVISVYDEITGTVGTSLSVSATPDGAFSFADIEENKFYVLKASSATPGETCIGPSTTPVLVTGDVTDALITCSASTGPFLRLDLISATSAASLATVNVFIGDGAIPDTTGTPDHVVNGSDSDVIIIPNIDGSPVANGFLYTVSIDANKYYAITVTTSSAETCEVTRNSSGGPVTANVAVEIDCNIVDTYSVGGTVSGLAQNESITLTLAPTGGVLETENVTGDADATADDTFAFDTELATGDTYTVTTTSPAGKTCTVNNPGTQTMGGADVTDISVTCVVAAAANAYSVGGTVTRADATSTIYVVLTVSDDNAGTGATSQTVTANATDGTFSFTGVTENKFYILRASSTIVGETCTSSAATPTQITANVTGAQVTCAAPAATSRFIRISLYSGNYLASLTTVNVFIGDNAIPATTGTATKVINGSDADVVLFDLGGNGEQYYYDVSINAGQYYAVTVTTTSDIGTEVCMVMSMSGGSAGPVAANATETVFCDQQWW